MKYSFLILLLLDFSYTHAQLTKKKSVFAEIIIKKCFAYNESNVKEEYIFNTSPQLLLQGGFRVPISSTKIHFVTGIGLTSSKYRYKYAYETNTAFFNQTTGVGITTIKLPVYAEYNVDRISFGCGVSLNHNRHQAFSSSSNFGGTDSFAIKTQVSSTYKNFNTVSGQVRVNYRIFRKSYLLLLFDIDFGTYPKTIISNQVEDMQGKVTKLSSYTASPKLYLVGLGFSQNLWQK